MTDKEIESLLTDIKTECNKHISCGECKYFCCCGVGCYAPPANWQFDEMDIAELAIKAWEQRRNHD